MLRYGALRALGLYSPGAAKNRAGPHSAVSTALRPMGASMSRYRLPRRLAAACSVAIWLGFAATAAAQPRESDFRYGDRVSSSRTSYGTPEEAACAEHAARGIATEQAVIDCSRALARERVSLNRRSILINRGAIYLNRREGEAALADFDAVIATDSDNAEAHVNRGAALIMAGRPGPAVAAITEALTLGVRDPHKAYYNRGAAREALGDLRGAYEDYSTALEIQPDWGPANAELARFVRLRRERLASAVGAETPPPDGTGAQGQ